MIFFYSGWGLLAPLFGFLGFAMALGIATVLGGPLSDTWLLPGFVLGGLVAAGLSWWLGSKLNHPSKGEIVIDRRTGERRTRRPRHSFMFIPMQYYAGIYAVIFGVVVIGLVTSKSQQAEPPGRHSANEDHSEIAALFAGLVGAVQAADRREVLSWTFGEDKDPLNDQISPKAESEVTSSDVTIQVMATCDTGGVDVVFATFRGKDALPFAGNGDTVDLRMRVDRRTERSASAQREYTNSAGILFYDPQTAQAAFGGIATSPQSRASALLQGLVGGLGMVQLQASAAGTIADLMTAESIRVELPLADGSANVVDLNPTDASLRKLIQQCVPKLQPEGRAAAPAPNEAVATTTFQQGLADRQSWENWFNGLTGENRDGALFWSSQRSLPTPGSCFDSAGRSRGAFSEGCVAARKFLTPTDARRNSEPEYRRGWNSY